MMNYPFPQPTVQYSNYRFDMSLALINKVLFQTVLISYKVNKTLHLLCLGFVCPLSAIVTIFAGYYACKVANMKHVRKIETTFVCYAFIEMIFMQTVASIFTLYYWTFGIYADEDDLGTTKFTCIFYLYFFNYLPAFCFNLVNCTVAILLLMYRRKSRPSFCGFKLTNFNLRTFYVVVVNGALLDVLFIFCISWIAMAKAKEQKKYQSKCFVLLNPIFQRFKIVNIIKGLEWQTQLFSHTIPYGLTIFYMIFAQYKILQHHLDRRRGVGLQLGEKARFGGCALTMGISIIFMLIDVVFQVFCDIYEIHLHYTTMPTDPEFFFFLKDVKTIMRTISYVLSPFQLLALCSLNPHFQHTMVRYLNGTTEFQVLEQTTLGGEKRTKVLYEKLPPTSEMKFLARLYFRWLRCYFAVRLFRRFLDCMENGCRDRRHQRRHRRENRKVTRERRQRAKKEAQKQNQTVHDGVPGEKHTQQEPIVRVESRIDIDPIHEVRRVSIASNRSPSLLETTV